MENHIAPQQVQHFVESVFKAEILKQYQFCFGSQQSFQGQRFEVTLKLDLIKMMKVNNPLGILVFTDYLGFVQSVQRAVFKIIDRHTHGGSYHPKTITLSQITVNFYLTTCPFPKVNLESLSTVARNLKFENGSIVFIKDAHIIEIFQPEVYLVSWTQKWILQCGCSENRRVIINQKQSLLEIVKNQRKDLRNIANIKEVPRCTTCSSKMKFEGRQRQIYKNCQKIKLFNNLKTNQNSSVFNQQIFECYLDQKEVERYKKGEIIDICMYLSTKPSFVKNDTIYIKYQHSCYSICSYQRKYLKNQIHNRFFGSLRGLQMQIQKCHSLKEEDVMLQNYNNFNQVIKKIKFPLLQAQNFVALKSSIINSIVGHSRNISINLFLMTNQPWLLERWISLPSLNIKKFPKIYDQSSLSKFCQNCHNSIMLFQCPSKKDVEFINKFLQQKVISNLNITIWVIFEASDENYDLKKSMKMNNFQIVLDLSYEKNKNVCQSVFQDMIDEKLSSVMQKRFNSDYLADFIPQTTVKRKNGRLAFIFDDENQDKQITESEIIREDQAARNFLQVYFLKSRNFDKMSYHNLQHLKKIAESFSYFRHFINQTTQKQYVFLSGQKETQQNLVRINFLDAILALFLDEESSRHRGSVSNSMFASEVSKLILNDDECQFSYRDYEYKENGEIIEQKKAVSKGKMFKIILNKIVNLVYRQQLDPLQDFQLVNHQTMIEHNSQQQL